MFHWNCRHLTRLCSKSSLLVLLVLGLSLPARSEPRPIIKVVTNQGLIDPVPAGGRWGLPAGMLGTQGNPIPVQDINAVSFRVGLFIDELFPSADTDDFNGTLVVEVDDAKKAVATVLELGSEPGDFASLPVQPLE